MLQNAQKIHCLGIGGIGISALAELWVAQGKEVSGSDDGMPNAQFPIPKEVDLIVYSDAVPEDHPQRAAARAAGITELSYAQALGEISRDYRTIVVTGTHGKSTTTALLGLMLEAGGCDPLVIVGSKVKEWGSSNVRLPKQAVSRQPSAVSQFFVVEGDDYRDHFLEIQPYAVVITSIEWDHPDYFRDLSHTVESFRKLVEKVPEGGFVVINKDDLGCQQLLATQPQHSNILKKVRMLRCGRGSEIFSSLTLQVPGEFNRYNATAAATAALAIGMPRETVEKVAQKFKGVWRRFEIVGQLHDSRFRIHDSPTIISDYGHHPTAIRATMKAAREAYPGRRLVLVYQPHQHSRTKYLFNDFVQALKNAADLTIVSEIYAVKGRMEDHDVSSRDIVEAIKRLSDKAIKSNNLLTQSLNNQIRYGGDLEQTKRVVLEQLQPGDVVIFIGAGDIDSLARELAQEGFSPPYQGGD